MLCESRWIEGDLAFGDARVFVELKNGQATSPSSASRIGIVPERRAPEVPQEFVPVVDELVCDEEVSGEFVPSRLWLAAVTHQAEPESAA